ncbi:YetF domain-containing protein [Paenisporosarcina antarctica]|uniref:DUF421 domain-containing protein n=1 Tax=Paenisporosarcina antarctica TaxID=417367 RepID=A0A4P6ZXK5_9BACL|nr:DUF421 domain-containing protein [Paenisporosarcina antarctica]QBP41003.1 DUF421 domain-containing protein [Paenisporosarcina antarctica]
MELVKELLILLGRVVTILPLMLIVTLFMGRRSVGELPIFDFLILMSLGAVVGADIADPDIEHIHTAVAVVLIGILQKSVAILKIRYRKFGKLITFEPTIVIMDGVMLNNNLKKIQYSIDNLLLLLREKDIFDLSSVHLAIIEGNGNLTVMKKPQKETVTNEDLKIGKLHTEISYPVIVEGKLYKEVLEHLQFSPPWLTEKLRTAGVDDINQVFFAALDKEGNLTISFKDEKLKDLPPIIH